MSKRKLTFTVTPGDGIRSYWIAIDDKDLPLGNGSGSLSLEEGSEHMLVWWMRGDPGTAIAIVGADPNGNIVVEVKKSKVPPGRKGGAGFAPFKVGS